MFCYEDLLINGKMTHSAEGTRQYNEFVNELYRVAMDENAPDAIKKKIGSYDDRVLSAMHDYAEQTKGMSKAQASYTVDTEIIADLSGDLMADDYIVNKLAERNAPLVKKLVSHFKNTIKKSATVDSESIKYLKKLVNKFEKSLDNAQGGVKISQIGNEDEEKDEAADSSQQTADNKVDDERKTNRNQQPAQEDIEQGKKLVEFINAVKQMQDKSIRSKRKHRIGFISKEHAQFTESLLEEIGIDIDLDGYELWIDGTGAEHVEIRHEEQGKADRTMSEDTLKEKIPWAVNYADSGVIMRKDNGDVKYSNRFQNSDGSRSPELKMYKKIDGETLCVSECVTDSKYRRIYITSAYIIKKDSSGQVLNMDENTSPQLTSKMVSDSTATDNSITENDEKDNSFDENNSKKVSDERKSVKRSYEPGKESEFEEELKKKYESTPGELSKYKKEKVSKASEKTYTEEDMLSLSMKLLKTTSDRDKSNKKIDDLTETLNQTKKVLKQTKGDLKQTKENLKQAKISADAVLSMKLLKTTSERDKANKRVVELTKSLREAKGDLKKSEEIIRKLADELNSKKYSTNDAKMAMEALLSVDSPLGRSIELKEADYEAAVRKLKNDLNSKTDFNSKANAALDIADVFITNLVATEHYEMTPKLVLAFSIVGYLKTHM